MTLAGLDGDEITVNLPTRFLRDWVSTRYGDRLRAMWQSENPAVRRVDIRVGGGAALKPPLAHALAETASVPRETRCVSTPAGPRSRRARPAAVGARVAG